ncbi:hypothetical protein [Brasilonema bromeliae]|uniref:Uncharacterized protein n=1 Tax=Brasilonema bromeliae SPC951 TaxID=385972 RepID=A0ABX1P0U3_9CYAN|nr:hypothetical protein [Brasilonema bromeliae]NMG17940.1 hypothetical protein [Brasilonema bromeliae SPC951]
MTHNNPEDQMQSNLLAFASAGISVLFEVIKDPFDEIRGHLTGSILRSWITENRKTSEQSSGCVVSYYPAEQKVEAFIVDEKNESLFTDKGRKIAVVFKAKSLDLELQQLFANQKIVLIPFD